jgi:catechol 2,3-dioxygenase-like lactoylglutathione lyase family enzyme
MSNTTTSTITGVVQIAISVADLERSLGFYRDVLGLPVWLQPSPTLAFVMAGGVRLMLGVPSSESEPKSEPIFYLGVSDLHAAMATFIERGAPQESAPQRIYRSETSEHWLAFTRDPDGHRIGLMAETPIP